jgi:hypothetical protein
LILAGAGLVFEIVLVCITLALAAREDEGGMVTGIHSSILIRYTYVENNTCICYKVWQRRDCLCSLSWSYKIVELIGGKSVEGGIRMN